MNSKECLDIVLANTYRFLNTSWRKVAALFAGIVILLFVSFSLFTELKFQNKVWYRLPAPCKTSADVMNDMKELVIKIHETLNKLQIPHAVCYGTLWGTLRNGQILPWDNNVDFCVNALDSVKVDRQRLIAEFANSNMKIVYSSRVGSYKVKYRNAVGYITTFLEDLNGAMYRTGWIHNLRWLFDEKTINFPAELLEPPFQTAILNGKEVPVPHENIEILKYLYPEDWWLEVKPPGC